MHLYALSAPSILVEEGDPNPRLFFTWAGSWRHHPKCTMDFAHSTHTRASLDSVSLSTDLFDRPAARISRPEPGRHLLSCNSLTGQCQDGKGVCRLKSGEVRCGIWVYYYTASESNCSLLRPYQSRRDGLAPRRRASFGACKMLGSNGFGFFGQNASA